MVWGCSVGCGNFSGQFSKEEAFMHSRETGHGVSEDNGTTVYALPKVNGGWHCSYGCAVQSTNHFDPNGDHALEAHALETGHALSRSNPYGWWNPPVKTVEVIAPKLEPKPESIRLPEAEPEL